MPRANRCFVEKVKATLEIGHRAPGILGDDGGFILREEETLYLS